MLSQRYLGNPGDRNALVLHWYIYKEGVLSNIQLIVSKELKAWCPIHTADADETKLSSLVASAVCTQIRN